MELVTSNSFWNENSMHETEMFLIDIADVWYNNQKVWSKQLMVGAKIWSILLGGWMLIQVVYVVLTCRIKNYA